MYFGACVKNELTDRAGKYLEEKFAAGGLLPHFYEDVRPKVWRKATSNSGFNTVCAVLRLKIKEVYDDPEGVELVWSVWREASDVAAALGIPGIWEYMQEEMPRIVKGLGDYPPWLRTLRPTVRPRWTRSPALYPCSGARSAYLPPPATYSPGK